MDRVEVEALMCPGDDLPDLDTARFRPSWQRRAACRGEGTDAFFARHGADDRAGKAICAGCPVSADCLEYALADPGLRGVWGGTSERTRQTMRRAMRKAGA